MEKIKARENRKKLFCKDASLTDQSFAKQCDINVILKKYEKTGVMPQNTQNGVFGDFSNVPTMEEAFDMVQSALESFQALPADVRKLMDNDASKLEIWLSNEQNREIAELHGLLEKKDITSDKVATGGQNAISQTDKVSTDNQTGASTSGATN